MLQNRILLISNTTQSFWIYRRDLIRHFVQSGYDVHCAAPPDTAADQVQSLGVTLHPIPLSRSGINPLTEMRSLWALWALLRYMRPDIIFAYTIKPNSYVPIIAQALSIPCISIVTGLGYSFISSSVKAMISRTVFSYLLKFSTFLFFLNTEDFHQIKSSTKPFYLKSDLLPGEGIDIKHFLFVQNRPSIANAFSFLMISRLLIDKGVREYIAAAKIVQQEYPKIQCHLLGPIDLGNPSAIQKDELDQAIQSGDIQYHPETNDVRPFIANADCIVLPSYREGIPKVLLEAGAMGKASITTDVPGCRDIIRNGENGLIVPAHDSHALAQAMIHFIQMNSTDRGKMELHARDHIVKYFSNESVFQKYDSVLKIFLKEK